MTTYTPPPSRVDDAVDEMPAVGPPRRDAERAPSRWLYVVLTIGVIVMALPFLWMLLSSVKPELEVRSIPPTWLPETFTLENYRELFDRLNFPTYFLNSAIVAVVVTLGNLLFGSMLGYALAKLDFRGKRLVFVIVLGTLMVPGMVTFVPLFVLVSNMGLTNTFPGLILPYLVAPLGVFLMRQYFLGLPDELIQAARVDGAGELRIFWSVMLPLTGPGPGDTGHPDVPVVVEQLPLAAGRGADGGHVHPAGRARAVLRRPERHAVRVAAGRRRRGGRAGDRAVPRGAAVLRPGHRDDRHQVNAGGRKTREQ